MSRNEQAISDVVRLAFLMGLCAAIGVYLILTTSVITRDGVFYIEQARQLGLDPVGVCRRHPPGYPFLLWAGHRAASLFVQGDSPMLWVYSAQGVTLLCRVLAMLPLYFLGKRLVGAADSFWALLVLILLPYPAFYGSDILREWPYLLLLSTGMLLLHGSLTAGRWWTLALVGLVAGLGYIIRPECAQLLVYALLGLFVASRASCGVRRSLATHLARPLLAGASLVAGFLVVVAPYGYASGSILPHQLRPPVVNLPPIISAVGPKAAADDALAFDVREGELLELPIQASDPDGDALSFSLAEVPKASRPVYEFQSAITGASFWTISGEDRDLLLTHYPEIWRYKGIAWYAYSGPTARPGLQPVYRFWSPTQQRHFFTMSESEKEAVFTESTSDSWTYEGAAFYAFEETAHPADAVAVFRLWDQEHGYSWATTPSSGPDAQRDTVAWYAHPAGAPPAGAGIEDGIFRWRPSPAQRGEHQINIIVSDGRQPCCQLVTIHVTDAGSARQDQAGKGRQGTYAYASAMPCGWTRLLRRSGVLLQSIPLGNLARAVNDVVGGIGEDLMVILVLPWILGLYSCFRSRAGALERVLVAAVLIVNLGLMLGRQVWFGSGSDRRYGVAMIALTIFYLPIGLDVMTRAMNRIHTFRRNPAPVGTEPRSRGFYLLIAVGVILCTPKLVFTPLRAEKVGLRTAGEWLRQNTPADAVVAEPDRRISLYAERQGLPYERYPDARKADYVIEIARSDPTLMLDGWTRVHSVALGPRDDRTVIIYRTARMKE
ncbi:MAG: glycosyltransferase family 39 protein [Phycisphaerales bacterium]